MSYQTLWAVENRASIPSALSTHPPSTLQSSAFLSMSCIEETSLISRHSKRITQKLKADGKHFISTLSARGDRQTSIHLFRTASTTCAKETLPRRATRRLRATIFMLTVIGKVHLEAELTGSLKMGCATGDFEENGWTLDYALPNALLYPKRKS